MEKEDGKLRPLALDAAELYQTFCKHFQGVSSASIQFLTSNGLNLKLHLSLDLELSLFAPLVELLRQVAMQPVVSAKAGSKRH